MIASSRLVEEEVHDEGEKDDEEGKGRGDLMEDERSGSLVDL